jgi:flagellin
MNSYRNYNNNTRSINKNLEKLSSGYRINRAGDDAAGLAVSEKMRLQITGIEVAQKNAKDGIGLIQTAEGALTEVHSMLNRMYQLAEQSANGTYEGTDRAALQMELESLSTEIDRIGETANFNGTQLFAKDGVLSGSMTLAIGEDGAKQNQLQLFDISKTGDWNKDNSDAIGAVIDGMKGGVIKDVVKELNASALGVSTSDDNAISILQAEDAFDALKQIKDATNMVSAVRGQFGAYQNRLEHTINNLSVMQENIQDAEATIRDTDVADEMMKYTKNSILVQSAQAMLAQANQQPQGVLQLLQ